MVEFGSGYNMPLDRSYESEAHGHDGHNHGFPAEDKGKSTGDVGVGIGDLGISVALGPIRNIGQIGSYLRPGSKTLEFVFMGRQKGNAQSQTPEYYGKKQRQALREMGKANRVDFTTHSTVGIAGLAGMGQGGFSKAEAQMSTDEVKRAIEFAADVGRGGPVVVHTGEFNRPVADAFWNSDGKWSNKFQMYEGEEESTAYRVVDRRTGRIIEEATKSSTVPRPIYKRYNEKDEFWESKNGSSYKDENGKTVKPGDYIDYSGNKIVNIGERVPRYNADTGEFEVEQRTWKDLEDDAQEMTDIARDEWRKYKKGKISEEDFKNSSWARFANAATEDQVRIRPEESYIIAQLESNAAQARGWAKQQSRGFEDNLKQYEKYKKALKFYKKLEEETPKEELWKLKKEVSADLGGLIPADPSKLPTEIIEERMRMMKREIDYAKEGAAGQFATAKRTEETIRHVESAQTYALNEAYRAYAEAAIVAMRQTERIKQEGRLKKPITIALENLFPEQYGAHPDELIQLVQGSRKVMAEKLQQQFGMNADQAKETAKKHVTATLDTGHLNIWRKYWKADPKKTIAANDKDFDNWILDKVKDMMEAKIIGHVHLDDNYGYHDDHLAPGEGNTPNREMVKLMKDMGYEGELIVEPGADYAVDSSGFSSVMKTWKDFGTTVYGGGKIGVGQKQWADVQYGFFGQTQPAYFTVGQYVPSEDWSLWSRVQLE